MPAINLIGPAWDTVKTARRQKEETARERIAREMDAVRDEFAVLVYRARVEGASISGIARSMQSSRTVVYDYVKRGEVLAVHEPIITDPEAEFVTADTVNGGYRVTAPHGESWPVGADRWGDVNLRYDTNIGELPSDQFFEWWTGESKNVIAYVKGRVETE